MHLEVEVEVPDLVGHLLELLGWGRAHGEAQATSHHAQSAVVAARALGRAAAAAAAATAAATAAAAQLDSDGACHRGELLRAQRGRLVGATIERHGHGTRPVDQQVEGVERVPPVAVLEQVDLAHRHVEHVDAVRTHEEAIEPRLVGHAALLVLHGLVRPGEGGGGELHDLPRARRHPCHERGEVVRRQVELGADPPVAEDGVAARAQAALLRSLLIGAILRGAAAALLALGPGLHDPLQARVHDLLAHARRHVLEEGGRAQRGGACLLVDLLDLVGMVVGVAGADLCVEEDLDGHGEVGAVVRGGGVGHGFHGGDLKGMGRAECGGERGDHSILDGLELVLHGARALVVTLDQGVPVVARRLQVAGALAVLPRTRGVGEGGARLKRAGGGGGDEAEGGARVGTGDGVQAGMFVHVVRVIDGRVRICEGEGEVDRRHLLALDRCLPPLRAPVARVGAGEADRGHVIVRVVAAVAVGPHVVGAVVPRPSVAPQAVAIDEVPRVITRGLVAVWAVVRGGGVHHRGVGGQGVGVGGGVGVGDEVHGPAVADVQADAHAVLVVEGEQHARRPPLVEGLCHLAVVALLLDVPHAVRELGGVHLDRHVLVDALTRAEGLLVPHAAVQAHEQRHADVEGVATQLDDLILAPVQHGPRHHAAALLLLLAGAVEGRRGLHVVVEVARVVARGVGFGMLVRRELLGPSSHELEHHVLLACLGVRVRVRG
eukprot:scaffold8708_cov54-Phaeocystis_antarctica.AAC.5